MLEILNKTLLIFRRTECALEVRNTAGDVLSQQRWALDLWRASDDDFVRVLAQATEIQQNVKNIQIVCEAQHFAFVPLALFTPDDVHYFLDFQGKTENTTICFNILKEKELAAVFAVPQLLVKALSRFEDNAEIILHLTEIIENKHNTCENFVQVWFAENSFDVLAFEKNQLIFYNSFKFNKKADVLYYLTVIFEQLLLNFEKTEVFLYNIEDQKDTVELLKKSFVIL